MKMGTDPKRKRLASEYIQNDWYPYYAGYADKFVIELLADYKGTGIKVLDPWNGTGTTTLCSYNLDIESYGVDINPVMVVIAKAKVYHPSDEFENSVEDLLNSLDEDNGIEINKGDPLLHWFEEDTVNVIRYVENELVIHFSGVAPNHISVVEMTYQIAYLYLLMFLSIRDYSKSFTGSNPTWIRERNITRVRISYEEWIKALKRNSSMLNKHVIIPKEDKKPVIELGDSKSLDILDESIDLVISSPPYCTRIDYAIYTRLELAILGINNVDVKKLREEMLGSPTIHGDSNKLEVPLELVQLNRVLKEIENHTSKAAKSYYYKTYKQYFIEMIMSVREINRVLKKDGVMSLVIQDSWFKDIHVNVPELVIEIAGMCGLRGSYRSIPVKNNMANINTRSREYVNNKKAAESIITLKKEK